MECAVRRIDSWDGPIYRVGMRDVPGVLVVEPDPVFRMMLSRMLVADAGVAVVGEVDDAPSAQEAVERLAPDVVLVALQLPGDAGLDLVRTLCGRGPAPVVVGMTAVVDHALALEALRAGCRGLALKRVDCAEVVAAVRHAVRGEALLSPSLAPALLREFSGRAPRRPLGAAMAPAEIVRRLSG